MSISDQLLKLPSSLTPTLKSLHWLKVNERIKYKILSLTYKTLSTAQPAYLHGITWYKYKYKYKWGFVERGLQIVQGR